MQVSGPAAAITGCGKCLPPAILTNDDLSQIMDTSDDWIRSRTGIAERRVSHVPTSELAFVASSRALASAGIDAEELDLVILATSTPDTLIPCAAAHLQRMLGARNSGAFDMNAGCTGFLYGLAVGASMVQSGLHRKVLIAGAEAFAIGRDVPHAVRDSIAAVPHRDELRRGLEILAEIFEGCCDPCVQIL